MTPVSHFFADFERNTASGDLAAVLARFADTCLVGGPRGLQSLGKASLAEALARRGQTLKPLGCRASRLLSVAETSLDPRYVLAQVRWQFDVLPRSGIPEQIEIDATYLIDAAGPMRILVYITHQDLVAILQARHETSAVPVS